MTTETAAYRDPTDLAAKLTGNAAPITVSSPADLRVVGEVPDMGAAEVAAAARELRAHQPGWDAIGVDGRARWMRRWRDWILDNSDSILASLQSETGKPFAEASLELNASLDCLNYYADNAASFLADQTPRPHGPITATKRLRTIYRPYQLVGVITPWNFPIALGMLDVVPALMAGCAVLSKPSEVTPLAWSQMLRGLTEEVGAPPVIAVVTGLAQTGAAVVDEVDFIQFTGSTKTGRIVARRAADRLIPCSLELGGKDAMIVLADCDLDRTVNGAVWGGLMNSGQVCISVERIYVEEAIYDEFVAGVVEKVRGLRQGAEHDRFSVDVGAMATEGQLETVERHVQDAVASGARVLAGGHRAQAGLFHEPTVLVDVDHTMACMSEETFGPTLPIMKVADADEAVRLANDSPYGLSATVWSKDLAKAEGVARRLDVGAVNINNAFTNLFTFPVPHSGWKESGLGARLGGAQGLRKYCRTQAITSDRIEPRSELFWYPYSKGRGKIAAVLTRALVARDLRRRLGR